MEKLKGYKVYHRGGYMFLSIEQDEELSQQLWKCEDQEEQDQLVFDTYEYLDFWNDDLHKEMDD